MTRVKVLMGILVLILVLNLALSTLVITAMGALHAARSIQQRLAARRRFREAMRAFD